MTGQPLDVVPLVNCVLLLLMFLVLAWNYTASSEAGIKVALPKAVTSEALKEGTVIISITREKLLYLNDKPVFPKELSATLSALPKGGSVLIKADKGTSLERVVEVWDICRNAEISQVNIATTQAKR